jgi:hypothetical protein
LKPEGLDLGSTLPYMRRKYATWTLLAACGGMIEDADLPEKQFIKEYCNHCPVKMECLTEGLWYQFSGVWGGTTETKRKQLTLLLSEMWQSPEEPELLALLEKTIGFPLPH